MRDLPGPVAALFAAPWRQRLVALRRQLHRYPELAFEEERSADALTAALEAVAPEELGRVAGTGVVAVIRGASATAPRVAVRGDIDALPIQEATGLEFGSERPGLMHACGHDVHAAWAVGAAHLLRERPPAGDVVIVLQPAEEVGLGAKAILDSGVLDGVEAIFGGHVDRRWRVGQVVADVGPLAAASDTFRIELRGRGTHGARPHLGSDPIVGAGALIAGLQTIVSRRLDPDRAGVVSVGVLRAGEAANVIPESASLAGTLRAGDPETRRQLRAEVARLTERIAEAYGLEPEIEVEEGTPPLVNPPAAVAWARRAVSDLLGEEALQPLGARNMAGEDFAFYLERIGGCFLRIGAREEGGEVVPAHSPRFVAAEASLFVGAAVLAETARVASEALAAGSSPSVTPRC